MSLEIEWTDQDEEHVARHGLSKANVDEALRARQYVRRSGGRYVVLGSSGPRTLFLVVERLPGLTGRGRVVTARLATSSEKRLLRRRGKVVP